MNRQPSFQQKDIESISVPNTPSRALMHSRTVRAGQHALFRLRGQPVTSLTLTVCHSSERSVGTRSRWLLQGAQWKGWSGLRHVSTTDKSHLFDSGEGSVGQRSSKQRRWHRRKKERAISKETGSDPPTHKHIIAFSRAPPLCLLRSALWSADGLDPPVKNGGQTERRRHRAHLAHRSGGREQDQCEARLVCECVSLPVLPPCVCECAPVRLLFSCSALLGLWPSGRSVGALRAETEPRAQRGSPRNKRTEEMGHSEQMFSTLCLRPLCPARSTQLFVDSLALCLLASFALWAFPFLCQSILRPVRANGNTPLIDQPSARTTNCSLFRTTGMLQPRRWSEWTRKGDPQCLPQTSNLNAIGIIPSTSLKRRNGCADGMGVSARGGSTEPEQE
jgi:hypothetical protein